MPSPNHPRNSSTSHPTPDAATPAAAVPALEEEEQEVEQETSPHPAAWWHAPLANDDFPPLDIATQRTEDAKARLATAHEGWVLTVKELARKGVLVVVRAGAGSGSGNGGVLGAEVVRDLDAFGGAIFERYSAASFLWRVLTDVEPSHWFGRGRHYDDTLRRLKTLKGLEASLVCWEKVLLDLAELADGWKTDGEPGEQVVGGSDDGERVKQFEQVLAPWHKGMPSRP